MSISDLTEKHQRLKTQTSWCPCCHRPRYMRNMTRKIYIVVPLLLLLPPVSRGVLDLRANNFIYHRNAMTWREAQAHCRLHHTDLVTIRDETENLDFFHGWIGLYRKGLTSKWMWSRGDEIANFTNWKNNYPHNAHNCAYTYRKKKEWYSDKCNDDHTFMCYDERLVLVKEEKTWEDALEHCRALEPLNKTKPASAYQNHRYDLATLVSEDDHVFAQEKAQKATTEEVWTGLRYLAGQWVWVGGEAVQHMTINHCPTKSHCGILVKNSTFNIRDCGKRRNFLCYKKL